jgi:hypothetical protein
VPEHLNVVGPKLSLNVVGAELSLSQNFARHSKFRVCVRKPSRLPLRPWMHATILAKVSSLSLRVALIGDTIPCPPVASSSNASAEGDSKAGRETVNTCGSCAFWLASA